MKRNVLASLLALLALCACSDAFNPIDPSGPPFSVFGVLDASADTQWIRINGLRSTLVASTAPTGFQATLENLGTGHVITLRDSATAFRSMTGSDSAYAHNFWTAERLEPGASYRFRVQQGSAEAESVVQMPRDYRVEVWISQPVRSDRPFTLLPPDVLWMTGVQQLPFVVWYRSYWDDCLPADIERVSGHAGSAGDSVARTAAVAKDTGDIKTVQGRPCGDLHYTRKELEIVASAAVWPFGQNLDTWTLQPGTQHSNMADSYGFLGGVLTERVPYERCQFMDTTTERYCKLRYDSTTATLSGKVYSACLFPPDSLRISLRELDAAPPEGHRLRRPYHDQAGNYEIGAIRPGIRHELYITGGVGTSAWSWWADTLTFAPGQHATSFATLNWEGTCPWQ